MRKKQGAKRSTSKFVGVRVPNDLYDALVNASKQSGQSVSKTMIDTLSSHIRTPNK